MTDQNVRMEEVSFSFDLTRGQSHIIVVAWDRSQSQDRRVWPEMVLKSSSAFVELISQDKIMSHGTQLYMTHAFVVSPW